MVHVVVTAPPKPVGVVVCVSGLGQGADQWRRVATCLPEHAVVAYDRQATNVDAAARELDSVAAGAAARHRGLRLCVLAHSWGAMIARVWASQTSLHPARLVLADPSWEGNSEGRGATYQRCERALASIVNPTSARELPAFYEAWEDLRNRDLTCQGVPITVVAARGRYAREVASFARTCHARIVRARSRDHNLPETDPETLAREVARET